MLYLRIKIKDKCMNEVIELINEMSPYLLLGFLIAGVMHVFVPNRFYSNYLSGRSFRSVISAALFGVPLPLCSCGVIPTAMSLRREGAGKGAVVSFLIATPQTGVDSIFATYSLMGLPFALVRPIAAFVTALMGGVFVNAFEKEEPVIQSVQKQECREEKKMTIWQKLVEVLNFGFVEMMEDIGKWLVVGLLIAGLITVFVPNEFFAIFKDNTFMSMLLVLCISIPMYLCATGSIPIAVALMLKGLTPGAALVLLMAGPACNFASILVINKVLGRRTLICYLIAIIVGAVAFGFGIDYLLPREWFTDNLVGSDACCHEDTAWYQWLSTGLLALLLLNVVRMKLTGHEHCHHHDHCDCCEMEHAEEHEFVVKGMNCNHCKANVEKAVGSIPGVKEVKVDLKSGRMTVKGEDVEHAKIRDAVESSGFSLED